jgi:hypothetical protein
VHKLQVLTPPEQHSKTQFFMDFFFSLDIDNNFDFQNITAERVEKIINTINIKKL